MIDGGVIAAYLAAAVARGDRRVPDRIIDGTLDRLAASVARRLGPRPATELAKNPYNGATLAETSRAIEAVAHHDARFARELAGLRRKLDKHGGLRLADQVRARSAVRAFQLATGGREVDVAPMPGYDPARLLTRAGILIALTGFVCWVYLLIHESGSDQVAPVSPAAFGALLAGLLLCGSGVAFSKATRRRGQDLRLAAARRRADRVRRMT